MTSYRLTFITPLFSKGSYDGSPEVRAASIRGQLHWWFRALGGSYHDEKVIFGGVHGGAAASKVIIRAGNVRGNAAEANTLPHKNGGQASPKWAYEQGASFELHLLERLGGLPENLRPAFEHALEAWLLLGTLGLRATRGGGSFSWQPLTDGAAAMPKTLEEWLSRSSGLLEKAPLRLHLVRESFNSAEEARRVVSDTIGGHGDRQGEDSLARIHHPLGRVFGGRKTSPLRFRIIQIGQSFHIAAVWDGRTSVTGNRPDDLSAVIELLKRKGKKIGELLNGFQ